MARTTRRRAAWRDIAFALVDYQHDGRTLVRFEHSPHSPEGRRRLARYHSDAGSGSTLGAGAPRWWTRLDSRSIKARNKTVLARWLRLQDYDPVFQDHHFRNGQWEWW
ncbi:hypothetical protein [Geopseudomonas aromaticivorans]